MASGQNAAFGEKINGAVTFPSLRRRGHPLSISIFQSAQIGAICGLNYGNVDNPQITQIDADSRDEQRSLRFSLLTKEGLGRVAVTLKQGGKSFPPLFPFLPGRPAACLGGEFGNAGFVEAQVDSFQTADFVA